jgi:hypothetical protein
VFARSRDAAEAKRSSLMLIDRGIAGAKAALAGTAYGCSSRPLLPQAADMDRLHHAKGSFGLLPKQTLLPWQRGSAFPKATDVRLSGSSRSRDRTRPSRVSNRAALSANGYRRTSAHSDFGALWLLQ